MENKNRVKINIAGSELTVKSNENEHYTERIAARLNAEIRAVRTASPSISLTNAIMLAALNICDKMTHTEEDSDKLRLQIKEYLNEAAKYRSRCEELETENQKLKEDLETYKNKLNENKKKESSKKEKTSASATVASRKVSSSEEAAD